MADETRYEIEKWIAIILALLFLLPFVARGQELQPIKMDQVDQASLRRPGSGSTVRVQLAPDPRQIAADWRTPSARSITEPLMTVACRFSAARGAT